MAALSLFKKYPGLSTLLVFEFVLFLIVSYQVKVEKRVSLLEKMGLIIFGPVQNLNDKVVGSVSGLLDERKSSADLAKQNLKLQKELVDYERLKLRLTEQEMENRRLRSLLLLPEQVDWEYVTAEIIGRAHRRNDYMITLNKGSNDGIQRDQGVFCPEGVVGVVWEVSGRYAKVMTANNPSSVLAAIVQDSRFQESFVSGAGGQFGRLENFPNFEEIKARDPILTSGLDGVFPKGLHIGRVTTNKVSSYMFQNVELRFGADFSRLEEVVVLVPKRDEVPNVVD